MTLKRIFSAAAILAILVIALGLFSMSVFAQTPYPPEPPENESGESEAAPAGQAKITADEAQAAAQAHLGTTAAPHEIELENDRGRLVYSVEFSGVEVEVDAATGEIAGAWSDND